MLDAMLRWIVGLLLRLRYRIRVTGLSELAPKDHRGILFLPNHPALVDPIIMLSLLSKRFRVGVLADQAQVDRPIIRTLAKRAGVKAILDPAKQRDVKAQIEQLIGELISGLNQGHCFLLYPSGKIYQKKFEDLGGNSAVDTIMRACPEVRIVMARTHGLWGSSFSKANGTPNLGSSLKRGLFGLLKSGLWFAPKRTVSIEFSEPNDMPRNADRNTINRYLEGFYNLGALPNTYVPYSIWETGGPRELPEPQGAGYQGQELRIPEATRSIVEHYLRELTGQREIRACMRLAHDLGLDSLARVELQTWIETEFGFRQSDGDSLETVGDVLLAACGEGSKGGATELKPVDSRWYLPSGDRRVSVSSAQTVTSAFLDAAASFPDAAVIADQTSGVRTYRDLIVAIFALKPRIERLEGDFVGIMLPASVAATITYLATLFAGKIPVMINWTTGPRGVQHCLEHLEIRHVLSARPLLKRLESEGFGKVHQVLERITYLEDWSATIGLAAKLKAALLGRITWGTLRRARCPEFACVLFTSGSESLPKAVPLTSTNILTNVRDVVQEVHLSSSDAMLGMLPPFHSFGLAVNLVLPMVTGLRVAFHPNPTEASRLAATIEKYQTSLLVGTPTFLVGIVNAATKAQLRSLRLAVTGAEQCPPRVYDVLAERCPQTVVIEGYGITECSPIVSANRPGREQRETIGEPMPSVEHAIVDPETMQPVAVGARGLLLVRGPSIFGGYLRYHGESPFVEYQGKPWYRTGDLVRLNERNCLEFRGRMKRFIKLGGEMISLPAIESVLVRSLEGAIENGPTLAVESSPGEHPELVLFTTTDIERDFVNRILRDAGLSPLHNIRQIRHIDAIPQLGTGKTDYRALKAILSDAKGESGANAC